MDYIRKRLKDLLNTIVKQKPFHLGLQSRLHYLIIIKMEVEDEVVKTKKSKMQKSLIGDNITRIGAFNFDNHLSAYPNLNTVDLSASVKEIGASAFSNVATLVSINLESVENIGQNAFGVYWYRKRYI